MDPFAIPDHWDRLFQPAAWIDREIWSLGARDRALKELQGDWKSGDVPPGKVSISGDTISFDGSYRKNLASPINSPGTGKSMSFKVHRESCESVSPQAAISGLGVMTPLDCTQFRARGSCGNRP